MLSPQVQRELIRTANRERLNSTEVESVLEFAEQILAFETAASEYTAEERAESLISVWKESFNVEP